MFVILTISNAYSQINIIGFDFSDNTNNEFKANSGLPGNIGYNIRAESNSSTARTITYAEGFTNYAASATNWDNGANDKFWSIKFKADGYKNFTLSSKQFSDANAGPANFKIQYKIGNSGTWTDIDNGTIRVEADWTSGVINDLPLPANLDLPGTNSIYIRWIMTDNNTTGTTQDIVTVDAFSKIDDILVKGTASSGTEDIIYDSQLHVFPNPAENFINIKHKEIIKSINIFDITGQSIMSYDNNTTSCNINIEKLSKGNYILKIETKDNVIVNKFTKQ